MVRLTRLNREPIYLNQDLIEQIESTPDTIVTLNTGQKYVVLETTEQVVDLVVAFRRRIGRCEEPAGRTFDPPSSIR